MKGSAQSNWDPREGQQPFRPNSNGVGDCTTTLRRLLIGPLRISLSLAVSCERSLRRHATVPVEFFATLAVETVLNRQLCVEFFHRPWFPGRSTPKSPWDSDSREATFRWTKTWEYALHHFCVTFALCDVAGSLRYQPHGSSQIPPYTLSDAFNH